MENFYTVWLGSALLSVCIGVVTGSYDQDSRSERVFWLVFNVAFFYGLLSLLYWLQGVAS